MNPKTIVLYWNNLLQTKQWARAYKFCFERVGVTTWSRGVLALAIAPRNLDSEARVSVQTLILHGWSNMSSALHVVAFFPNLSLYLRCTTNIYSVRHSTLFWSLNRDPKLFHRAHITPISRAGLLAAISEASHCRTRFRVSLPKYAPTSYKLPRDKVFIYTLSSLKKKNPRDSSRSIYNVRDISKTYSRCIWCQEMFLPS